MADESKQNVARQPHQIKKDTDLFEQLFPRYHSQDFGRAGGFTCCAGKTWDRCRARPWEAHKGISPGELDRPQRIWVLGAINRPSEKRCRES